ncbi:glycosyltransferase family 8 protein [Venturia nashicola]|nr:glycosyltransferase family 8 protein [Venturia nashicola]
MASSEEAKQLNPDSPSAVGPKRVWTTLITNTDYLPGLLTLEYSLKKSGSKYPLVALYTDAFPHEGHAALKSRGIPAKKVAYLLPSVDKDYSNDPRFYDCWSKLTPFSLTEYDRVVQLDSDMLVLQNMDELMEMHLDAPSAQGQGNRVFAASHACVCNPWKKPHYPKEWVPANCAYTSQHPTPDKAQEEGAPPTTGLAMPNGGLQVVNPSIVTYNLISERLNDESAMAYDFADQSLLSDLFHGRWVALPYKYNALKFMRWKNVHSEIWQDEKVKNLHLILSPKPWDETEEQKLDPGRDDTNAWWWKFNDERKQIERENGIDDKF